MEYASIFKPGLRPTKLYGDVALTVLTGVTEA